MRITSESDYALRILSSMAEHKEVTDAKTLAAETSVTQRFTLKILHKLVTSGIVESYKGARGGYRLNIAPDKITLKMVIELIDGPIAIARCVDNSEGCSLNCDKASCHLHHIFDYISFDIASKLDKITISDVINGSYRLKY